MAAKKAATAVEAPKAEHVVKAGGAKGTAIVELLRKEPGLTRTQVADKVGATVGRVGEVVRWLRDNGTADEKKVIEKHTASQPPRKTAEKKATPTTGSQSRKTTGAAKKAAETAKSTPRRRPAAKTTEPAQATESQTA